MGDPPLKRGNLFSVIHFSENILKELIPPEMVSQIPISHHLNIHYFTPWNNLSSCKQANKVSMNLLHDSIYHVISEGRESAKSLLKEEDTSQWQQDIQRAKREAWVIWRQFPFIFVDYGSTNQTSLDTYNTGVCDHFCCYKNTCRKYFENLENLVSNLFIYGGVEWNCSALKVNVPKMLLFEVSLLCHTRNFLVF